MATKGKILSKERSETMKSWTLKELKDNLDSFGITTVNEYGVQVIRHLEEFFYLENVGFVLYEDVNFDDRKKLKNIIAMVKL